MLKRIQNITNIGRFIDCKVPGCEFGSTTIIFGYNTQGKSTFTSILRSIQTGNNDILIGRKTFGATTDKKVEIDFVDGNGANDKYVFQNRAWNKNNEHIVIFDSKFITDNVFDGESISFDQQKNLNTIIIGKKGQDLNNQINALQAQSEKYTEQKRLKTKEFARHFPNKDAQAFCSLALDTDIDQKISDKEKEIKFERDKDAIKTAVATYISKFSNIKFDVRDSLVKTLDVKQDEIEEHIKAHFVKTDNAQTFLSEGLDFLHEKSADNTSRSCVFCGQVLGDEAEKLIDVYASYFKGGYADLQKEVSEATEYFTNMNLEAGLNQIATDLKSKDIEIGLTEEKVREHVQQKKNFEEELKKKRDLNYVINFSDFDTLKSSIDGYKEALEEIQRTKLNAPSPKTLAVLEAEKAKLELVKQRHEPKWVQFCDELATIEVESENVRKERETKRTELDAYSAKIFDEHKETINTLCKDLGADFELVDFKPLKKLVGKDERIFAIKFFGTHKVSIDNNDEKTPNFKNTLSESDRRLLAFAFFLSLLKHDHDLSNKIVVFDDPMSSFDYERRRKTVHHITDLSCTFVEAGAEVAVTPVQKIVLTHEDRFARELKRLIPDATTLKILDEVDNGTRKSSLCHADFSKDFPEDDISSRIEEIKTILDSRNFTKSFEEDCRIVLEHIFRRKYYLDLKDDISKRKGVRTFTVTLAGLKINGFDEKTKYDKFIRLCDDLNIELHDNSSSNSNGDKESILKDFFECLKLI